MADSNIKTLSEEELELVNGGTDYRLAFITRREDGNYAVESYSFAGDEAAYRSLLAGRPVESLGFSGTSSSKVVGADKIDAFLARQQQRGYEVIWRN